MRKDQMRNCDRGHGRARNAESPAPIRGRAIGAKARADLPIRPGDQSGIRLSTASLAALIEQRRSVRHVIPHGNASHAESLVRRFDLLRIPEQVGEGLACRFVLLTKALRRLVESLAGRFASLLEFGSKCLRRLIESRLARRASGSVGRFDSEQKNGKRRLRQSGVRSGLDLDKRISRHPHCLDSLRRIRNARKRCERRRNESGGFVVLAHGRVSNGRNRRLARLRRLRLRGVRGVRHGLTRFRFVAACRLRHAEA